MNMQNSGKLLQGSQVGPVMAPREKLSQRQVQIKVILLLPKSTEMVCENRVARDTGEQICS